MTDDTPPDVVQLAAYCTATPRADAHPASACPDCEHATVLHIGTSHCPVCEMVDLSQQARAATASTDVTVNIAVGGSLAEKAWAEVQRRHHLGLARAPYPHKV